MDIFGKPGTPRDSLGNRALAWPTTRAMRGKYYSLPDPVHAGDRLVVMSYDTWADFGTMLETATRAGKNMDKQIKELVGEKTILAMQAADLKSRLEAVQEARRKEKKAEFYQSHGVS